MHFKVISDSAAMNSIQQDLNPDMPIFTIKSAVSILVSSDFLRIDDLVHDSLIFIAANL